MALTGFYIIVLLLTLYHLWNGYYFVRFFIQRTEKKQWFVPVLKGWGISLILPPPFFPRLVFGQEAQYHRIMQLPYQAPMYSHLFGGEIPPVVEKHMPEEDDCTPYFLKMAGKPRFSEHYFRLIGPNEPIGKNGLDFVLHTECNALTRKEIDATVTAELMEGVFSHQCAVDRTALLARTLYRKDWKRLMRFFSISQMMSLQIIRTHEGHYQHIKEAKKLFALLATNYEGSPVELQQAMMEMAGGTLSLSNMVMVMLEFLSVEAHMERLRKAVRNNDEATIRAYVYELIRLGNRSNMPARKINGIAVFFDAGAMDASATFNPDRWLEQGEIVPPQFWNGSIDQYPGMLKTMTYLTDLAIDLARNYSVFRHGQQQFEPKDYAFLGYRRNTPVYTIELNINNVNARTRRKDTLPLQVKQSA